MSTIDESSENTNSNSNIPQNEYNYENENELMFKKDTQKKLTIDNIKQRYPYCLVWTPIPCISWFIPSIGHAGICNSEGVIHDFAGPYCVSVDNMAFGNPTKFVILELSQKEFAEYDKAVEYGKKCYNKLSYDFFTNNCHSFIASVLNNLNYKGKRNYNMVNVWWILSTKSKYITWTDLFKTYYGFIIIICFILILSYFLKH